MLTDFLLLFLRSSFFPQSVQLQTLAVVTLLGLLEVTALNLQRLYSLHSAHHLLLRLRHTHKQKNNNHTPQNVKLSILLDFSMKGDETAAIPRKGEDGNWILREIN